jgi:hypothetical protein
MLLSPVVLRCKYVDEGSGLKINAQTIQEHMWLCIMTSLRGNLKTFVTVWYFNNFLWHAHWSLNEE